MRILAAHGGILARVRGLGFAGSIPAAAIHRLVSAVEVSSMAARLVVGRFYAASAWWGHAATLPDTLFAYSWFKSGTPQ